MSILPPELSRNEHRLIDRNKRLEEHIKLLEQALSETSANHVSEVAKARSDALEEAAKAIEKRRDRYALVRGVEAETIRMVCNRLLGEIRALASEPAEPEKCPKCGGRAIDVGKWYECEPCNYEWSYPAPERVQGVDVEKN